MIDTNGNSDVEVEPLVRAVRKIFPLTPQGIIDHLKLRRPIYRLTAAYGHFGRLEDTFTWEKTDKAAALRRELGLPSLEKAANRPNGLRADSEIELAPLARR
jgi:S-adenosylmethionine synthetase